MKKNIKTILQKVINSIKPSSSEIENVKKIIGSFNGILDSSLKKQKILAETFIGGSIAKNTIVKRKRYDIDVFVRFSYEKYKEREMELGGILEKAVLDSFSRFKIISKENVKFKFERVHGSRDYFNINFYNKKLGMGLIIEIVPTLCIKKPQDSLNITDLSFFHVKYVVNGIKKKKVADDIMLAKAFCYAQGCYGAESHIKGFSGYAIELLILHYGGFGKFIKNAASWKGRVIIDPAKKYKNENDIMTNINEAKLQSPIILIDPTYAVRNVCAAVSGETFIKFVNACKEFVKKPSLKFFQEQKIDKSELKNEAKKRKAKLAILKIEIKKDKEDIAASKIVKFCNFIIHQLKVNDFNLIRKEIEFLGFEKGIYNALIYAIYKEPSAFEIVEGPPLEMKEYAENFKKKYKKCFEKKGRIYAKTKRKIVKISDLITNIKTGNEIKDMQIFGLEIVR